MRSGVILIDKPAGVTSAGVVARVKRLLQAEKVGHAGTLDPDATGLLVCLINAATRVAAFAVEGSKVYSGVFRLGVCTSSDDLSGEIISETDDIPSFDIVEAAASRFVGELSQVPPRVSAKKIQGRRAHDLERAGVKFELLPREVSIYSLELWSINPCQVGYRVHCSPGTYVRALARDLGRVLGCGGAAESIRRERSGHLEVMNAVGLEQISWDAVQDWAVLVPEMPRIVVSPPVAEALLGGKVSALKNNELVEAVNALPSRPTVFMYSPDGTEGEAWGLLSVDEGGQVSHRANLRKAR